jgi:hypothetical protein
MCLRLDKGQREVARRSRQAKWKGNTEWWTRQARFRELQCVPPGLVNGDAGNDHGRERVEDRPVQANAELGRRLGGGGTEPAGVDNVWGSMNGFHTHVQAT